MGGLHNTNLPLLGDMSGRPLNWLPNGVSWNKIFEISCSLDWQTCPTRPPVSKLTGNVPAVVETDDHLGCNLLNPNPSGYRGLLDLPLTLPDAPAPECDASGTKSKIASSGHLNEKSPPLEEIIISYQIVHTQLYYFFGFG